MSHALSVGAESLVALSGHAHPLYKANSAPNTQITVLDAIKVFRFRLTSLPRKET
jgi:hypothetical protein